MLQRKRITWGLFSALLLSAANATAQVEMELIPEDECVIELALPLGTEVTLDGKEYGKQVRETRKIRLQSLTRNKTRSVSLKIRFPSGKKSEHLLIAKGGQCIRIAKQDPKHNHAELVESAGMPPITGFLCSSNFKYLVAGHQNMTVSIWDLQSKRLLRYFDDHDLALHDTSIAGVHVAISPNGSFLASPPVGGKSITIYDVVSGNRLRTYNLRDYITSVAFSPNEQQLLVGSSNKTAILWSVASGKRLRTFEGHTEAVTSVAFSPNGRKVITGSDDATACLWDLVSGRRLRTFEGHTESVGSVAFSPDGHQAFTGSSDETAILWDVKTGQKLSAFHGLSAITQFVMFSPDGLSVLAKSSYGDNAEIWNLATGRRLSTFEKNPIAFGADGKSILVTVLPYLSAQIIDAKSGDVLWEFSKQFHQNWVGSISRDRNVLTVTGPGDDDPGVYSLRTGKKIQSFKAWWHSGDDCETFLISSDGTLVLTGDKVETGVTLRDVQTGRTLRVFESLSVAVSSDTFSSNGRQVLAGSWDKAEIWGVGAAQIRPPLEEYFSSIPLTPFGPDGSHLFDLVSNETGINYVVISPDCKNVLTGMSNGKAILWDADATEFKTFEGHTGSVNAVSFSPCGHRLLTVANDGKAILWDAETAREIWQYKTPSQEFIRHGVYDESGQHILLFGHWRLLYVLDAATGELVLRGSKTNDGILFTTPEGLFDGPAAVRDQVSYRVGQSLNVLPVDQFFNGFYYPGLSEAILRGERPLPKVSVEPPPAVKIVSPASNTTTSNTKTTIVAVIEDEGGGIASPFVQLNGTRYSVDEQPVEVGDKKLRWRFTIPLVEGVENVIEVHSATASGAIASEPGRVVIRCEQPKQRPELYMVAVGINDYLDDSLDLECARQDAEALADVFRTRGEAFYGVGKVHVTTVLDSQATHEGIQMAIKQVAANATPNDVFVLTISGHGVTLGERYYFIPYEYQSADREWADYKVRKFGLAEDELEDWIAEIKATKRILVYDTCQSGGALSRNARNYEKALEALARRSGCHVIAASASTEDAQELPDVGHGALTYALLGGLGAAEKGSLKNESAAAKDGIVSAIDWFQFASENVPKVTADAFGIEQFIQFKTQANDFAVLPVDSEE